MTCYEKDFGRGRLAENRSSKTFIKFHIDVGVGDAWIEPHDEIKLYDWLDFAGISSLKIPIISAEQHFAEKIHAYTLPRSGAFNSRVKDLVDIVLLIKHGKIKKTVLTKALKETFEKKRRMIYQRHWTILQVNGINHLRQWPTSVDSLWILRKHLNI